MGYMHINNLYKDRRIFHFKECYAMEKIHGTSSHIGFKEGKVTFFSGGSPFQNFVSLFNIPELEQKFIELGHNEVVIFGEAYGGKLQGMSSTYGPNLKFAAFDVKIEELWLNVENAHNVCTKLGLEFVDYVKIPTNLEDLDREREKPSTQAIRNCVENPAKRREGIVIRPVEEYRDNRGERIITKYKNPEYSETKGERKIKETTPEQYKILNKAQEIADEWCTDMRLEHVLDKFPNASMTDIPNIIEAMYQDIIREAEGEIIESSDLRKAIYTTTAKMFKKKLQDDLNKLKE